jgi:hypothetical protein
MSVYALSEDELKKRGYELTSNRVIRKWENAFIKGNGILRDKTYSVKK